MSNGELSQESHRRYLLKQLRNDGGPPQGGDALSLPELSQETHRRYLDWDLRPGDESVEEPDDDAEME